MKISKRTINSSFDKLKEATTNKFWGLLSIFQIINEKHETIVSNLTYEIETAKISDILDDWFYFGQDKKNYNSNNIYVRFSSNWIEVFSKITSKEKPNILDVAIFCLKNEDFEDVNSRTLVNIFIKKLNLNEHFLNSNFNLNFLDFNIELENDYSRRDFLEYFKKAKSIDINYETLSFSSPFLIVSKPSELKRAPFIQTLYSGTEIMELLLIADFDFDRYYFKTDESTLELKNEIVLESKVLYKIIFESFKYIYLTYGEEKVLSGFEQKKSNIENREYIGITLPHYFGFETIIGIFQDDQGSEKLKSSKTSRFVDERINVLNNNFSYFTNQWNAIENGRGLTLQNFNRLLTDVSKNNLEIINESGFFKLIRKENFGSKSHIKNTQQIIYYGAPGTGKSYKVDNEIKNLSPNFYERITFHPEFDHTSFVGGYKPKTEIDEDGKDIIKYKFVPQSFTNIYVRAWNDQDNQYYLAIEEINRGNCAEIFGDLFQLLDRNSNYTVSPSNELDEYLRDVLVNKDGIIEGLKLPPNLTILATMNTSDQSLFPMDSAFKRRWDWEYIPICYNPVDDFKKNNDSFDYEIDIEDGHKYSWIKFIEKINLNHIKNNPSLGMDKCIGNYFIKPDNGQVISLKPFINKVIFYLWNDVFKDEENKVFEENTSYEDFFPIKTKGKIKIKELFERIELTPKTSIEIIEEDTALRKVAEEAESEIE